jgi:beta-glucosidase
MSNGADRVEQLVEALTLEEKASLTGGDDVWHLPRVARLGIGRLKMSDGPSGVRGQYMGSRLSLSFPCGTAAGATWDVDLVNRYGAALAGEARAKGVHLLLGPTVGTVRTPLGGRTFESFSEDPFLSAELAVAYIRGVQAGGVGCCVKHFACNDQEHERMTISAEVDERTLRELHLPAFEAAVGRANVWAVMSAYNRLNGTYCGEHPELLTHILKDEWGFDGVVVSDWFGNHSTVDAALAGLDVEMPGPPQHLGAKLAEAVRAGDVDEKVLDDHVRRILRLAERTGLLDHEASDEEPQDPEVVERRAIARELATAGTVLLRNESLLPLDASVRRVAVIGPNVDPMETGGGGSSQVTPWRMTSFIDELRARLPGAEIVYEKGLDLDRGVARIDPRLLPDGLHVEYFASGVDDAPVASDGLRVGRFIALGDPAPGVPIASHTLRAHGRLRPDISGTWQLGLVSTGGARLLVDGEPLLETSTAARGHFFFGMGTEQATAEIELQRDRDYEIVVEHDAGGLPIAGFELGAARPAVADPIGRAVAAAAEADVAIVVVGSNSQWETEGNDRPDLGLVGGQDELIERVAAANRRTAVVVNAGSPVESPWAAGVDALLMLWYPGEEGPGALAAMLTGEAEPKGRLPVTFPRRLEDTPTDGPWYPGEDGKVVYGEGVFVGYRHYDSKRVEPAFAFGAGLSYTTFAYGEPVVVQTGRNVRVRVPVTNTGVRRGSEVVQIYVHDDDATVERPLKELKAFAKVELDAGETTAVELDLDERSFAFWNADAHQWTVEPGAVELLVGASSRDIRHRISLVLP